ncbi:MAG: DUF5683 domain-containing protein [Longimicrobiales bacterium]
MRAIRLVTAAGVLVLMLVPCGVAGQGIVALTDTAGFQAPEGTPSPRGALIRSLAVPGWGQAATGSTVRGGIYFAAASGSWFMLSKTLAKLGEVREIEGRRVDRVLDSLAIASGTRPTEPFSDEVLDAIDADSLVEASRALIGSRERQREDWIAQVIFWTLASAADAYVTTQLADFPGEVLIEPTAGRGLLVRYALPMRKSW